MENWINSELMAQLTRHKRFPPGAGVGTASVTFTIRRMGEVLSARLADSSGDRALDAETVSLPRRASRLPAPPPGIGAGGSITIAVPVRLNR
jgi:protein TonB